MNTDFLQEYAKHEVEECKRIFQDELQSGDSALVKLRKIYGAPVEKQAVYLESGSIDSFNYFPADTTHVVPIFPYRSPDVLEKNIFSIDKIIRENVETERLLPVLQHPLYYEGFEHLRPLFRDLEAPSYFIRGQFAYAAILDAEPDIVESFAGIPLLRRIDKLMKECLDEHSDWIEYAIDDPECWEHRYRNMESRNDQFYERLRRSLSYRYASVALCIGKESVDNIIEVFSYKESALIILHLHIIFDHVICHGFGSDYVIKGDTNPAKNYKESKSGILDKVRYSIGKNLRVIFPNNESQWFLDIARDEHFLKGFSFSSINEENIEDIRYKIDNQFAKFREKVRKLDNSSDYVKRSFSIVMLGLGITDIANQEIAKGLAEVTASSDASKFPEHVSNNIIETIKDIYRENLGSYLIKSGWE